MEKNSKQQSILSTAISSKFDINGNHKISSSELGETLKARGSKIGEDELKRIMFVLGTDGDDSVDIEEFKAIFCGDKDRNRKISATELHSILKDIGENFSLEKCRRMIRSVDVDGYGYVNFKELKKKLGRPSSRKSNF